MTGVHAITAGIETAISAIAPCVESIVDASAIAIESAIDTIAFAIETTSELVPASASGALRARIQLCVDAIALLVATRLVAVTAIIEMAIDALSARIETRLGPVTTGVDTVCDVRAIVGHGGGGREKSCDEQYPCHSFHLPTPWFRLVSRFFNAAIRHRLTGTDQPTGSKHMAVKRTVNFVKTTAIGGLLVLLPLAIILYVVGELLFTLYTVSLGIIEAEPTPQFVKENPFLVIAAGVGALIGFCFLTGLVVKTRLGNYLKHSFKEKVVNRIPVIRAVQRIAERFAGIEGEDFAPVEVEVQEEGIAILGVLVERLPDGRCAVFVPASHVTTVGNVLIVAAEKVRFLDASISDAMAAVSQWGMESERLYGEKAAGPAKE